MSRMYRNTTSGIVVVTGPVKALAPDNMSVTLSVTQRTNDGKYEPSDYTVKLTEPANPEDFPVGKPVTAYGYQAGINAINAEMCTSENAYGQCSDKLAVIAGNVLFASYRSELDENGQPRLNRAGAPRKPHFDITVTTGSGRDRVNHTVKIYNFTDKNGEYRDNISSIQKRFEKFDRETNPMYVCIATQPGETYSYDTERNGQTYHNTTMSHMGYSMIDSAFVNALQKDKGQGVTAPTQAAPTAPQPAPAPVPAVAQATQANGFDISALDVEGLDDIDFAN